jgi:hypothetical protein
LKSARENALKEFGKIGQVDEEPKKRKLDNKGSS